MMPLSRADLPKRLFDLLISASMLVLLSPLLGLVALGLAASRLRSVTSGAPAP